MVIVVIVGFVVFVCFNVFSPRHPNHPPSIVIAHLRKDCPQPGPVTQTYSA